jgi:RND superfamily putative drug exporter
MSARLGRIASAIATHWKRSLLITVLSIFVLGGLASTASPPADDFDVPGADSQKAIDLFRDHTPEFAGADATLVYTVDDGKITDAGPKADIEAALARVAKLDGVKAVDDPFGETGAVSDDGKLAAATARYVTDYGDIEREDGDALEKAAAPAKDSGVQVEMRGAPVDIASEQEFPVGELVGVGLALILLTLLFRSKAAMGATLLGAILGVAIGQMLLAILADPLELPSFATTIAVMLGLGAGIDYSLLIIGRFREQRAAGEDVGPAVATAARTAGMSVVAAGLIVMVAIAGLLVVGIPAVGKMGVAAAIGVFAVVISALFILPSFIGAFAKWVKPKRPEDVDPSPAFHNWGEKVTRNPWATIAIGVGIMLVFAAPVLDMRLGQPDDGNQPTSKTQRVAYDQLSAAFGAGSNGPLILAVDTPAGNPEEKEQLAKIVDAIKGEDGIESVAPAVKSPDGAIASIIATPTTSPQDKRTSELLERLRDDVLPAATAGTPLKVYVGGQTAGFEDFSAKVSSRLPLFIGVVIGLSVLLLMAAFRSVWIPIVSAVFNLLSILAAYGAVTAVFQKNIGAELIGADSGVPVVSFIPVLMFAIVFGLSMDYNVFLLSRMQEAYNQGAGPREAVVAGMARIGKLVLFAGLIMASVFLAFVTTSDVISKMFGIGLGVAILLDVLFVRLVIAPAVVTLLGDKAWWMPSWLDRLLPNISLEGSAKKERERQPVAAG